MTNSLFAFCQANPNDKRVVRIMRLLDRPLSLHSPLGRLIGELAREIETAK